MMIKKIKLTSILNILCDIYPDVNTQLYHKNEFELLIATILSAQCTDKQVNHVTRTLFKKYSSPKDFTTASPEAVEKIIHSTGFFRNKAKNIINCSKMLINEYDGQVPDTLDELVRLPGVGRKTANVVLSCAYNKPAIAVDTHVARISGRLGLTEYKNPVKIEFDLMKAIPIENWNCFSMQLILLGRSFCKARKPDCLKCPIQLFCCYTNKIL